MVQPARSSGRVLRTLIRGGARGFTGKMTGGQKARLKCAQIVPYEISKLDLRLCCAQISTRLRSASNFTERRFGRASTWLTSLVELPYLELWG
ncbi:hypothetical protein THAOC_14101, partial [Thalassiosira oceanica]